MNEYSHASKGTQLQVLATLLFEATANVLTTRLCPLLRSWALS